MQLLLPCVKNIDSKIIAPAGYLNYVDNTMIKIKHCGITGVPTSTLSYIFQSLWHYPQHKDDS